MKNSKKRRNLLALTAAASCLFALVCGRAPAAGASQSERAERVLEDKIPSHVPIKVKVKNLDKEHWARELEVEVKNTGRKPIYYLKLFILMPEAVYHGGSPMGFPFWYGRPALGDIRERPTPEDIPIKPGETYTFKIREDIVKGWEGYQEEYDAKPKKFRLMLSGITFGDGTGFEGTGGAPLPSRSATDGPCPPKGLAGGGGRAANGLRSHPEGRLSDLPVRFLPASLFLLERAGGGGPNPRVAQSCCDNSSCDKLKRIPNGYNCECGPADKVESVPCRETGGQCGKLADFQRSCVREGYTYYCTDFYVNPCPSMDLE